MDKFIKNSKKKIKELQNETWHIAEVIMIKIICNHLGSRGKECIYI